MPRRLMLAMITLMLLVSTAALADEARIVPQEVLDAIVDDNPNPLPRHMTPGERLLPMPRPEWDLPLVPPTGRVRTPAEYERNAGLLIRWGSYNDLLTAMTVGISTGDPEAVVYILVSDASQQASATSTLSSAGADMGQVELIIYDSDTVWIRDYGPRFISQDNARAMVDHTYNRPRPADNDFPDHLSALWNEPEYDLPLSHGGGNFHLFAGGDAFMTDLILDENPGVTEQEVVSTYAQYENVNLTIMPGFPYSYDSTQHIDMWMLPVDDDEVIIGEYPVDHTAVRTITEDAVTELASRGYTVHRVPGWNSGGAGGWGTHYTYTNSVVFNDLLFACQYDGSTAQNTAAMSTFQTAFPNHQIIPVNCSSIIHASGAIHCIVMHVPEIEVLFADGFESGDLAAWNH